MLVNFDMTGRVIWYNTEITKENSVGYLSENTIWIENTPPAAESKEEYIAILYVNEDMQSLRVEYQPIIKPELTINEKICEAVRKNQDELRQEGADLLMEELMKRGLIV